MNSVGTLSFSFNHKEEQPTKQEVMAGLNRATRTMNHLSDEWLERIEIDDTQPDNLKYEESAEDKKSDWIVVDEHNHWLAAWQNLTQQEALDEINEMYKESPDLFRPDVEIFSYRVQDMCKPSIQTKLSQ